MHCKHGRCLLRSMVVFVVALTFPNATAWAVDSDVLLANVNGQVAIGAANDLGTADEGFDLTTNLFQGVMVPDFPPFDPVDYGRDEPGFFALGNGSASTPPSASALPGDAQVTIHFPSFAVVSPTDSLFYWNGNGAVNFQPISTAQPGVSLTLHPNPIATTHADGSLHQHSAWELDNGGAGVPADGVYLLSPTASVVGLADSKPFYMLFLVNAAIADEDAADAIKDGLDSGDPAFNSYIYFNAAADYVRENPAVMSLLGVACVALAMSGARQRRRGQ